MSNLIKKIELGKNGGKDGKALHKLTNTDLRLVRNENNYLKWTS